MPAHNNAYREQHTCEARHRLLLEGLPGRVVACHQERERKQREADQLEHLEAAFR